MNTVKSRVVLLMAMLIIACKAYAQYEPTTTWPYLYPEFQTGELCFLKKGTKSGLFNIHIIHGKLHFIQEGMIYEATMSDVFSVTIGDDVYMNNGGQMMKVLAKHEKVYITEKAEVDINQLNETGGAYGASSTTLATTAYSSLESIGTGVSGVNHMELKNSKNDGKSLPLLQKKYIVFPGYVVYATRKDVMEIRAIDSKLLGAFIKKNKIKWKDPQSLLALGIFLNEQITK